MKSQLLSEFKAFTHLIYPRCCITCGSPLSNEEKELCISCLLTLPKTDFHNSSFNPLNKILKGRIKVRSIHSYYYFDKGLRVQRLLHHIKYSGKRDLAVQIGEWYGYDLKKCGVYEDIHYILPVPLHESRLKVRGYNQSEAFAEGLSKSLNIELGKNLVVRNTNTTTQTKKSRIQRWENVSNVFQIPFPEILKNKNILLVDDVITTGATLEACAQEILNAGINSLRIATIACALKI